MWIEDNPLLLGQPLMIIGRQVPTAYGGFIDLLAVDREGVINVLELKRDKTPRDVVAQVLDYGSWVAGLDRDEIVEVFEAYKPGVSFDSAFAEVFGDTPDEINSEQRFVIVAASVDGATERIVRFLSSTYGVPIDVLFINHFVDGGVTYLARAWLAADDTSTATANWQSGKKKSTREPWNGTDWYVAFGEDPGGRQWQDARHYGFVSAGGGAWYSKTLRSLPIGARVFVHIPKHGYVGIGKVTGEPMQFADAVVSVDDTNDETRSLKGLPLAGHYIHNSDRDDPDSAEWVVPVAWEVTVPIDEAKWQAGFFANQNSATRLRSSFTIATVSELLGLQEE